MTATAQEWNDHGNGIHTGPIDVIDQFSTDEEEGLHQSISGQAIEMPVFRSVVQEEITLASDVASRTGIKATPISTDPDYYEEPKDFQRELKRAKAICKELSVATREMINDVRVGSFADYPDGN